MIILTDSSGLVLETAGDPRTIDFGQVIHLEQGGRWKEADIGTNAIGTAIAESQPVQIHGLEHFCSEVKRWTCAATPIWHPTDGKLLGVIDISGPVRTFNPQSLAFAVALGRQIEGTLAQSIEYDHERLLRYFMMKRSLWASVDVLAIDQRGRIVFAPESLMQSLEREQPGLISNGCISSLKNVRPADLARSVKRTATEHQHRVSSRSRSSAWCYSRPTKRKTAICLHLAADNDRAAACSSKKSLAKAR